MLQGTMKSAPLPASSILLVAADGVLRASLEEQLTGDGRYRVQSEAVLPPADRISSGIGACVIAHPDPTLDAALLPALLALQSPDQPPVDGAHVLTLPVRMDDLLAVLDRLITSPRSLDLGRLRFHPAAKLLIDPCGDAIRLTEKETIILERLVLSDKAVDRQTLLSEIWGYNPRVTTHTLETHIYRLRQKIKRDPALAGGLVHRDGGYMLIRQGLPKQ